MDEVEVRSPTRIDLAGGTLDLWPLYAFLGKSVTVNIAINIYTTVKLQRRLDSKIEYVSSDLKLHKSYDSLEEVLHDADPGLKWLRVHLNYWRPKSGLTLTTSSESPIGGGIGGSSSLTVGLIQAFLKFENLRKSESEIITLASNLEAQALNTPTGTQDYYPALLGGLNMITYEMSQVYCETLEFPTTLFEKCALLVYSGHSHHSGLNNWQVLQSMVQGDLKVQGALEEIRTISFELAHSIQHNEWSQLGDLFSREYDARIQLSKAILSPEIEKLSEIALNAGAQSVKICGAGGGGCILVWSPPDRKEEVKIQCEKAGFLVLKAKPVKPLARN